MIEIFLPVIGFEKMYEVSTFGRVRSHQKGKILFLKEDIHYRGYRRVRLYKNKKCTNAFLHRVVAQAFLPNPENKEIVNHKDRNKTLCALFNLEWMTQVENVAHYYACIKLENDNF